MSTLDLREPGARVDRSGQAGPAPQDQDLIGPRPGRAVAALVVALSLAMIAWLGEETAGPPAKTGVASVGHGRSMGVLPLEVNARVERWMEVLQTSGRAEFQALLDRSGVFEGLIRAELRERAMPEELLYLAMIESGLSPLAESRVAAVGLWQFMDPTARELGLRMDDYVDERRDPVRATEAALDYLYWLRARYGSWYLAVAAYNAGPARIERILALHADGRTGREEIYWEVLRHLPRETREYVPRLVATALLAEEAEAHGFQPTAAPAYVYDLVFVPGGTELSVVAGSLGVQTEALRALNPHLIRGVTPPSEIWALRVPRGGAPAVVAALGHGWSAATSANAD